MDLDQNGFLSYEEILTGLRKQGHADPKMMADRIFQLADMDSNRNLDFNEWCLAILDR